jgi:isocitrate dehydrogenase (NAD+)
LDENYETLEDIFLPQTMDLYAYVVHAFTIPGIKTRHKDIDIVVIRENSEGEYSTIEHEVLTGVVESIKVTTKAKSMRIAEYAFEYAHLSSRTKVTCVHKANIIKKGDGDFLNAAREVADRYPRIKLEEMIVDAACMNLISHPDAFDVILLPNLYGSIIGNVVSGLVGGAGIAPGANIGRGLGMFEQGARCSGVDLLHSRDANPTAFMLAG